MGHLRIYAANSTDTTTEGLCGPLLATESEYSMTAGTFGELTAKVIRDDPVHNISKWKSIAPGCLLKATVPVRTCSGFGDVKDLIFGDETKSALEILENRTLDPITYKVKKTTNTYIYTKYSGSKYTVANDQYLHYYMLNNGVDVSDWTDISTDLNYDDQKPSIATMLKHIGIFFKNCTTISEKQTIASTCPHVADGYVDVSEETEFDSAIAGWILELQNSYFMAKTKKSSTLSPITITYQKVAHTFTATSDGHTWTKEFDDTLRYFLISKGKITPKTKWNVLDSNITYGTKSYYVTDIRDKIATFYLKMTKLSNMLSFVTSHPNLMSKYYTVENGKLVAVPSAETKIVYSYTLVQTTAAADRALYKTSSGKSKSSDIPLNATLQATQIAYGKEYVKVNAKWDIVSKGKTISKTASGWIKTAAIYNLNNPVQQVVLNDTIAETDGETYSYKDQLFRIYDVSISNDNTGTLEIKARHIVYDLLGNVCTYAASDGEGKAEISCSEMAVGILGDTVIAHDFKVHSDLSDETRVGFDARGMNPIEAICNTSDGILSKWKYAQIFADNYDIYILSQAGMNRGFTIEYGKNLIGVTCETDQSSVCTMIMPIGEDKEGNPLYLDGIKYNGEYYYSEETKKPSGTSGVDYYDLIFDEDGNEKPEGTGSKLKHRYFDWKLDSDYMFYEDESGKVLSGSVIRPKVLKNNYPFPKIYSATIQDAKIDDKTVKKALAMRRLAYTATESFKNGANDEKITLDVEFSMLGDSETYSQYKNLERLFVYDTVYVSHNRLGITATNEILKFSFDTILERFGGVEIGAIKNATASVASWQISSVNGGTIVSGTVTGATIAKNSISANHIDAESINAATLRVDNLVVLASDGNYYKMQVTPTGELESSQIKESEVDQDKVVDIDADIYTIEENYSVQQLSNEADAQMSGASTAVAATTTWYKVTSTKTAPSAPSAEDALTHSESQTNEWVETRPNISGGQYLWSFTRTVLKNSKTIDTQVVCIAGDNEKAIQNLNNELWEENNALYFGDKEKYAESSAYAAKITNEAFIISEKGSNTDIERAKFNTEGMRVQGSSGGFVILATTDGLIFANL